VLDSLKTSQQKHNDKDGLRQTVSQIEQLYREHDEIDPHDLGDISDSSDESDNGDDDEDDDDDINLAEISDDSGLDLSNAMLSTVALTFA